MKKIFDKVIIVCGMMFSFTCCAQKPAFGSYSPAEFERLLQGDTTIQLVDVRTPDEFEAGHIDNALLINVLESDFLTKAETLLDKSKPVAVYCRSGRRSKDAAAKLSKKGYKVHELEGGYIAWMEYINSK